MRASELPSTLRVPIFIIRLTVRGTCHTFLDFGQLHSRVGSIDDFFGEKGVSFAAGVGIFEVDETIVGLETRDQKKSWSSSEDIITVVLVIGVER